MGVDVLPGSRASRGELIKTEIMGIMRVFLVDPSQIICFCGFALNP